MGFDTHYWDTHSRMLLINIGHKKRVADFIAPLQPTPLASVKTWGNLQGAGREGLPYVLT